MAKEVNKRVNIWLNQQGIENNLKLYCSSSLFNKKKRPTFLVGRYNLI